MRRKKELKGKNIYLNEDLTQYNRFIVGNIKRTLNEGERLWTREGKIFVKNRDNFVSQLVFAEYQDKY